MINTTPKCLKKANKKWILLACMLAMFMAAIEVTIVATAMPTIIAELGGFDYLAWVFAIYLVVQAITVPIYGRLADLYGRKPVFYAGAMLFLAGSVMCGFSASMLWLIVFRALQGIGAGAITPLATTIVADVYNPEERAKTQGYLSSVWAISAIIGPLMGAFIVEHYHWSGVFWVNVPLGVMSLLLIFVFLPSMEKSVKAPSLDTTGIVYLTLAISSLLVALLQSSLLGLWLVPLVLFSLLNGWLLVRQEKRVASPLFPLALWRSKIIVAGNVGGLIIGAAMMGIAAFLPTYLQAVMGASTLDAGWTLAVMSLGWPLASTLSGRIMLRTSYRFTAFTGALLLIAGCGMLLLLTPETSIGYARLAAFIIGTGMGMSNTTFLVSVQNEAEFRHRGIATASTMFTRMLGQALGTAVLGATLNLNLHQRLPTVADPIQRLIDRASGQGDAGTTAADMMGQVAESLQWVFGVALLISIFALYSANLIPRHTFPQSGSISKTLDKRGQ
ncbi:MDR family MFS transporter [Biostraticola tofi]|uniref:EmrB/QacA subfamily drug resistance transporter n=1 Tax=Biostraticola tofi TaxID=466109 RepID=A0A4V2W5H2_9GAMM|nr:MDR family MFS transporter [Biostraticola tofi]TCV99795.1 EmrB/QacA subfamily drug resistance transporter [Biostraticola tofi]